MHKGRVQIVHGRQEDVARNFYLASLQSQIDCKTLVFVGSAHLYSLETFSRQTRTQTTMTCGLSWYVLFLGGDLLGIWRVGLAEDPEELSKDQRMVLQVRQVHHLSVVMCHQLFGCTSYCPLLIFRVRILSIAT